MSRVTFVYLFGMLFVIIMLLNYSVFTEKRDKLTEHDVE